MEREQAVERGAYLEFVLARFGSRSWVKEINCENLIFLPRVSIIVLISPVAVSDFEVPDHSRSPIMDETARL